MDIRLINLDRSPERLAVFQQRNQHVPGIQRVSAVDGKQVSRQELLEKNVLSPEVRYTDGAIGAALSHLMQWSSVLQSGQPATIVEDDAILCLNFVEEATRLLATLPDDWEIVLWGYNFDTPLTYHILPGVSSCVANFDQVAMRKAAADWPGRTVTSTLFPLYRTLGICAYSISLRGAQRLFGFCTPLRPIQTSHPGLQMPLHNTGIDNMMAFAWPAMQAFVAVPALVLTPNDHSISSVQTGF